MPDKSKLKSIYSEILKGFSVIKYNKLGAIFVKHLTSIDITDFDYIYDKYFLLAREKELPTSEEKEQSLIEIGDWTKEKNRRIYDLETFIKGLYNTKNKLWKEIDIQSINNQIKQSEEELENLKIEKANLLGETAESYASKKLNESYIYNSFYKVSNLKEKFFTKEEFDELDNTDLTELIKLYNIKNEDFSENNLKSISLASYFSNFFYLADDNVFNFYGKPIIELTFYQVQLFTFGQYFKGMFSDSKTRPPEHIMEDPEKIIEWFNSSKNLNELIEKNQKNQGNIGLVGASKEDLKKAGITPSRNSVDLFKEAKKRAGGLSMKDMIELDLGKKVEF